MATNYKHQYETMKMMVAKYQDEIVPELRKIIEDLKHNRVEVVRCKDCKHWNEEIGWCDQHSHFWDSNGGFCQPWESCDWKTFDANNFCSYGERKDND